MEFFRVNTKLILVGTFVLFVWNALSWMALPFHSSVLNNIPEEAIDTTLMQEVMPEAGVYHYPGLPENDTAEEWEELSEKTLSGPRVTLMVYSPSGAELFSPTTFLLNIAVSFIAVALALYLFGKTTITTKKDTLVFFLVLGIFAGFAVELPQLIWFNYPVNYGLVNMMDHIVGWGLVGLAFSYLKFRKGDSINA